LLERAGDIGGEGARNTGSEGEDEGDEPDA
jgi:hypothetical protein